MSKSLFALTEDAANMEQTILDIIDTDEDFAESLLEFFSQINDDIANKVDRIASVILTLKARSEAIKQESVRLAERARIEENKRKGLEEYVRQWLASTGKTKADGVVRSISVRKNGGLEPIEWIGRGPDPELVPREYVVEKVDLSVDSSKVREALKSGVELDFARLGERGTRLVVQ